MLWNLLFNPTPKPFEEGKMPEKDGHRIHYYQYGNLKGVPVLSFHGGPGGESRSKYAKLFNLNEYRFIQFDQRGCGKSEFDDLLYRNETKYNLEDAKRLLEYLNIDEQIIVHGVSWGATMALLFAEKYPQLVKQIIVSSVFLARDEDSNWVNRESERFYPDLWNEMRSKYKHNDFFNEHKRLLFSKREADNLKALKLWGSYEYMLGQINPNFENLKELNEEHLKCARIAFYYDRNQFFLKANQILRDIVKIKHIPAIIAHNRFDFCCTVKQAWDLHSVLPKSELIILPKSGHSTPELLKTVKKMMKKAGL